jgi:hypothetical protein
MEAEAVVLRRFYDTARIIIIYAGAVSVVRKTQDIFEYSALSLLTNSFDMSNADVIGCGFWCATFRFLLTLRAGFVTYNN